PRRGPLHLRNAGFFEDVVALPQGVGEAAVKLHHDVLLGFRCPVVRSHALRAAIFSKRSASRSKSFAVLNRASQMAGLPARSANSRYQQASSRSLRASSIRTLLGTCG